MFAEPQITGVCVDINDPRFPGRKDGKGTKKDKRSGKRSSSVGRYESSSRCHLLTHSKSEKLVPGVGHVAVKH